MQFPQFDSHFLFGTSTASYQIEGAVSEDGRGPSIWDTFCRTPGKVENGDTGDIACDHYHRYKEDVKLMADLGVGAYRFSVAWPRVQPSGSGKVNPAGIDFYDRLVDELLANQVEPWACLYHWDLPQALQDRGGWTNRDIVSWYTDYALIVTDQLGDRVKHWITLNEPAISAYLGYYRGIHAPGIKDSHRFFAAMHHLNLAQGFAWTAMRSAGGDWLLGTVVSLSPAIPEKPDAQEAANRHDAIVNWAYTDPVLTGAYPQYLQPFVEPFVQANDLESIRHPLDFLGVNYYFPTRIENAPETEFGFKAVEAPAESAKTGLNWEIRPDSFEALLKTLHTRYPLPPLYITENGVAYRDEVDPSGFSDDQNRIQYISSHLQAVKNAKDSGVDVRGYFTWSLLDNFEWAYGYWPRFGLVRVDYSTLKRTPKASFNWMKEQLSKLRVEH
jgi:beta-glucosidase